MKQGARFQVLLMNKGKFETLAWEFEVGPDATSYVGESKEIEVDNDLEEVIIKIFAEGEVNHCID